jgi:predicted kinase
MTTLAMLIGLPASGKSTFRSKYSAFDHFVYSTDDIIEEIAKENNSTYSETFSDEVVKAAIERADEALAVAVSANRYIVWDQTNLGMYKRQKALSMIPDHYNKLGYVFLPPCLAEDFAELKRRLTSREGKSIPESVMIDMMDRYQMPTITEGFDDLVFVDPFENHEYYRHIADIIADINDINTHFLAMRNYVKDWRIDHPEKAATIA